MIFPADHQVIFLDEVQAKYKMSTRRLQADYLMMICIG